MDLKERDDLSASEDERGAQLARPKSLDTQPGSSTDVDKGIDDAENFANDPANASGGSRNDGGGNNLGGGQTASGNDGGNSPIDRLKDKTGGGAAGLAGSASKLAGVGGKLGAAASLVGSFAGKNKKRLSIGGVIAALLLAGGLGFTSLLPLKIESMMKNIYKDYVGNRVERPLERRAMRMMAKFAFDKDGTRVITGSPLSDLFSTWKSNRFEAKLQEKSKITFGSRPGGAQGLRITFEDGTHRDFINQGEMRDFFNGKTRLPSGSVDPYSSIFKESFQSATKWKGVFKRRTIRLLQAKRYGVSRWRKKMDSTDTKTAQTDLETDLRESSRSSYGSKVGKAMSCLFGDAASCPDKQNRTTGDKPVDPEGPTRAADVTTSVDEVLAEGADVKAVETKTLEKLTTKGLLKESIPIIGWIDLGARMDKLVYSNTVVEIITDMRKAQYASTFASWLTITDQIKDGSASGAAVNAAMLQLAGSEKSNASHRIYSNDPNGGEKVDDDKLFGTKTLTAMRTGYVAATLGENGPYHRAMDAYLHTVGWVLDQIGGFLSSVLNIIPGVTEISAFVGKYVMKGFMAIFAPVVTGKEVGAFLMNVIDVGGDVTGNDLAEGLGGAALTTSQIRTMQQTIAKEDAADARSRGWWYRFTSPEYRYSATTQLAVNLPSSPAEAVNSSMNNLVAAMSSPFTAINQIFSRPLALTFSPAYADAVTPDPYGLATIGFTEDMLDADVDEAGLQAAAVRAVQRNPAVKRADGTINAMLMDSVDCDEDPDSPVTPNQCKLDLGTIQTLIPAYTTADDGGVGGATNPGTPASATDEPGDLLPTGTAKTLAQQILDSPNFTAEQPHVTRDLQLTVSGQPGTAGAPVSAKLLAIVVKLLQNHRVTISEIEGEGQGHAANSRHYAGVAVDFVEIDGVRADGRDAASIKIIDAIKGDLPSGSRFGQQGCPGATPAFPTGITDFNDPCTHLHMDLPRGTP